MPKISLKECKKQGLRKPQAVVRTISDEEAFLAQEGKAIRTRQPFRGEDMGPGEEATIQHTRPDTVQMWKRGADGRYTPRVVSETAKAINLASGWKIRCPDCDTNHEASPYPPGDPNACPAREPVAVRICPVCGKRIFDNMVMTVYEGNPDADPNVIPDEYENTTPATRTRLQLNVHMWVRHPQQAQMRGLEPLPVALREMAQQVKVI